MGTTANYSLTYPDSTDHTRLWEHFQALAEDVDDQLALIRTLTPVRAREDGDLTGINSTSFASGSPVCGAAFTAPASGAVVITVCGRFTTTGGTNPSYLGWVLATGDTPGSGSDVVAATIERAYAAVDGAGSHTEYISGLTPGDDYNAYTQHRAGTGSTFTIHHRLIIVQPVLG